MPKGFSLPASSNLPYLSEYLGCWCMLPHVLEQAFDHVSRIDLIAHIRDQQARSAAGDAQPRGQSYQYDTTESGIAIVHATGTLMKQESSLGSSTSTVMLRRTIRAANRDPDVKAIMLRIDSPGGSSLGTEELAEDIYESKKPVAAYIDGVGASAAYWLASQASFVSAMASAVVGSIGTFMVVRDSSAAAAANGVKVHLVRSSENKGAGTPGTEVTSRQLAEWQRTIDQTQAVFTAGVARGREVSMDEASKMADARVHIGQAAKDAGLIDYIENFESAIRRLESSLAPAGPIQPPNMPRRKSAEDSLDPKSEQTEPNNPGGASAGDAPSTSAQHDAPAEEDKTSAAEEQKTSATPKGEEPMAQNPPAPTQSASAPNTQAAPAATANEPKPATIAELKAAFPTNPAFALDCAEKAMTLLEARAAYADVLQKENETLRADAKQNQPAAGAAAGANKPGVKPIATTQSAAAAGDREITQAYGSGEAADQFKSLVEDTLAKHPKMSRMDAVASVARKNPELHQQYIEANQQKLRN